MSLGGRLLNVFAAPGDVFDEVKTAKDSAANWLVPALILILVSWAAAVVIFSQDSIKHQLTEITDRAVQKQVDTGHLTEQQAEQARLAGAKWASIGSKIVAGIMPVFVGFVIAVPLGAHRLAGRRQGAERRILLHEGGGGGWAGEHDPCAGLDHPDARSSWAWATSTPPRA